MSKFSDGLFRGESIFYAGIISGHRAPEKRTRRIGLRDVRHTLRSMSNTLLGDIIDGSDPDASVSIEAKVACLPWNNSDAIYHLPVYFRH